MEPLPAEKAVYEVLRTVGPHPGTAIPTTPASSRASPMAPARSSIPRKRSAATPITPKPVGRSRSPKALRPAGLGLTHSKTTLPWIRVSIFQGSMLGRLAGERSIRPADKHHGFRMKCMLIGAPTARKTQNSSNTSSRAWRLGDTMWTGALVRLPDLKAGDYEPYDFIFLSETTHSSNMSRSRTSPGPWSARTAGR